MCGLCGVFGQREHWSDAQGSGRSPAAERQHRARMANRLLDAYGLKLDIWMGRFTLTSRTGRGGVVEHIGGLWPLAEKLAGRTCDPLDEALLRRLEGG